MNEKSKNFVSFFLRLGLSAALLFYIFSKIDLQTTKEVLKNAHRPDLAISFVFFVIIQALLLPRWMIFIYALDLSTTFKNVLRHFFLGHFGNLFMPTAIGGDILKTIGLCRGHDTKPRVVASVLLDRLSGFAGIVLLALCSYALGFKLITENFILIPIAIMGVSTVAVLLLLFNTKIYTFGCQVFGFFPRLKKALIRMHDDILMMKDKKIEGVKAVLLAALGQVGFAFSFYFIAKSFGIDVSIVYFLIFVPIICVITALPSIGGLGVREVATVYLFGKIGVDANIAASISLSVSLFIFIIGLIAGAFYVITLPDRRVQRDQSDSNTYESEVGRPA